MLAAFGSFLLKIGIGSITSKIADAYLAKQNATTDREKIAADERIRTLEAKRAVMVAEAGSRINAIMRAALAAPVAVILWKIFIYDKALGQWTHGTTDALSPELWNVVMVVVGFYFIYETARVFRK